jgi:hypothetical protein
VNPPHHIENFDARSVLVHSLEFLPSVRVLRPDEIGEDAVQGLQDVGFVTD